MPPALRAVLTSSCVTLGLQSSIRPLTRSVTAGPGGIRGSAPHHGIELWRSYIASGLADPGCPVSPSLHHHPRNPVRSSRLAQPAAATLSWYLSPRLSMAQAMRAVLLAMASSTTLVGRRTRRPVSQAERICFLRLDQLRWARAPCTNRRLM